MYRYKLILSLVILASSICGQEIKSYYCKRTRAEITVDGQLSEAAWKEAKKTDDFVDITGKESLTPPLQTNVKMLWDDKNLYIAAIMEEPGVWASIKKKDAVIFHDNDFEVFIDPDGDTHNYVELEINALGTIWDLLLSRPYRDRGVPVNGFDIAGLQVAVQVNGTINDPGDVDQGWTVEIAIPFEALALLHDKSRVPELNEHWRINFSRVEWEAHVVDKKYSRKLDPRTGKPLAEENWTWTPQGVIDMHRPERWGYLVFVDSEPVRVPTDLDESLKLYLRKLYYEQRKLFAKTGKFESSLSGVDRDQRFKKAGFNRPDIRVYGNSMEVSLVSKVTGLHWVIDDLGLIVTQGKRKKNWVWMGYNRKNSEKDWEACFRSLRETGIAGVLMQGGANDLKKVIPLSLKNGIELHAWSWILNCNRKEILKNHPDWYNVNRKGEPSCTKPAYVGYYKWLCPSNDDALAYLRERTAKLCQVKGLAGVHMDYIRHPDVILPVALQPKYKIVQDKEYPQYDYCYCQKCKNSFKRKYKLDIDQITDPTQCKEWRQFRYDAVKRVVEAIQGVTRLHRKKLTAAVFPSPSIARRLVRQNWDKWPLDAVFPMTYQNFYNAGIAWIGQCVAEGAQRVDFPIYPGLFLPALDQAGLAKAIMVSRRNGARGVALFSYGALCKKNWGPLWTVNGQEK